MMTQTTREENFNSSGHSSIPLLCCVFLLIFATASTAVGVQRAASSSISLSGGSKWPFPVSCGRAPLYSTCYAKQWPPRASGVSCRECSVNYSRLHCPRPWLSTLLSLGVDIESPQRNNELGAVQFAKWHSVTHPAAWWPRLVTVAASRPETIRLHLNLSRCHLAR